jgi:amino acid transporter
MCFTLGPYIFAPTFPTFYNKITPHLPAGSSIAEIVSAFPTCGGLYTASAQLCPRKRRPIVGWVVGWLNILGQVAGVSSTEFGLANMIWAAVSIAKVTSAIHPITQDTTQSEIAAFYITGWKVQHHHRENRWLVFWPYDFPWSPRQQIPHPPTPNAHSCF